MNERSKELIKEQNRTIPQVLADHFELPVFQDNINNDEVPPDHNYFLIVYGDISRSENQKATGKHLSQDIYVVYLSEKNDEVDENCIDIISLVEGVKATSFQRTTKERVQKADTSEFVDRVTLIFSRMIKYERSVSI
ncbi:hypothetical protein ACQKFO_23020 [Rossellomorea sp. NPDC071047]|uniref:hypothetical protein n=1 Tax=Rossellomorea sp. NPDC071047 TaxID=3390675 RepID=UPI003CFED80D